MSTRLAAKSAIGDHLSTIINPFTAYRADHPRSRMARQIIFTEMYYYSFDVEKISVRSVLVKAKLTLFLTINIRKTLIRQLSGRLQRNHSHCISSFHVKKRGRHFTVVLVLKTALAQTRTSYCTDSVSHTTINLDPDNQLLAIDAARIVNTYALTS